MTQGAIVDYCLKTTTKQETNQKNNKGEMKTTKSMTVNEIKSYQLNNKNMKMNEIRYYYYHNMKMNEMR